MVLALCATAIVIVALLSEIALPWLDEVLERRRANRRVMAAAAYDPGREQRAERRARALLRSCVNQEEWAMYRDLGFIRVYGGLAVEGPGRLGAQLRRRRDSRTGRGGGQPAYAYLIYPHKPIVAYVPATGRLLSEYCVEFPDLAGAISGTRLPDSDDVLAKWMALTGDERRLIADANMHLPGRQVDPGRVRRDLWRLAEWERLRRGSTATR